MQKSLAVFTTASFTTEREFRAATRGNFRRPPSHFTPCQIASEMALAAGGTLYLQSPNAFSRSTLKHVSYLYRHMPTLAGNTHGVRPLIILAFSTSQPFTRDRYPHIAELFSAIEPPWK